MDESEKSERSWWQTLPGILTGIAGIITALTALIAALIQGHVFGPRDKGKESPPPISVPKPPQGPSPTAKEERVGENLFRYDFEGDQLGKMYENLTPDPMRIAVGNGRLTIVAAAAGEGQVPKNLVLLQQRFPGDFTATIHITMQVLEGNSVGLQYWVDSKNRLFLGVYGLDRGRLRPSPRSQGRHIGFTKYINGEPNSIWGQFYSDQNSRILGWLGDRQLQGYASEPEVWYLQLERKGFNYTGRVRIDGVDWQEVGTHTIPDKNGRLGLAAVSSGSEKAAEFDPLEVKVPNKSNQK